jgi:hypothetical protein
VSHEPIATMLPLDFGPGAPLDPVFARLLTMTTFPGTPKTLRGGIVLVDPSSGAVIRVIALQYNPDSISRTLQVQGAGEGGGARSEALRLKGPAVETFKLEAELDATDQLEAPDNNPNAVQFGLHPQIAALESLINPTVSDLVDQNTLASFGTIEIAPAEAPLDRGGLRSVAQSDPRQAEPRPARALGR